MQMMIAQDQRRASLHVAVNAVPRGHDFAVGPGMAQEVAEVSQGARGLKHKSIGLQRALPLLEVSAQVRGPDVVAMPAQPVLDLGKQSYAHRDAMLNLLW